MPCGSQIASKSRIGPSFSSSSAILCPNILKRKVLDLQRTAVVDLLLVPPFLALTILRPENAGNGIRRHMLAIGNNDRPIFPGWHENLNGIIAIADRPMVKAALNSLVRFAFSFFQGCGKLLHRNPLPNLLKREVLELQRAAVVDLVLVSPFLAPTVLQPENACNHLRRHMLAIGDNSRLILPGGHENLNGVIGITNSSVIKAALNPQIRVAFSFFQGRGKFFVRQLP